MSFRQIIIKSACLLLLVEFLYSCQHEPKITRIAFGSCSTQELENKMWPSINEQNPDVFIWLGDNIYGDSDDPSVLAEKYNRQKSQEAYQSFLQSGIQVYGTWDDHDYGWNDAGKEYPIKADSKRLLLDFLDVPAEAKVRDHDGVYQSYELVQGDYLVKIILLDTRWFRDALALDTVGPGKYMPSDEGTMLGEAQWSWLEKELTDSKADVHIIGSSIQVISQEHGWEKWANFPHELNRLYELISDSGIRNPIIISGDRHLAEVSARKLGNGLTIFDITSSGMTHVFYRSKEEANQYRVSPFIQKRNWGLINIDWTTQEPTVSVEIRGEADSLFHQQTLNF